MNCDDFRQEALDRIREGFDQDLSGHTSDCPDCARWIEQERGLSAALADLASAGSGGAPGANVERAVLEAFAQRQRKARSVRLTWLAAAAALVVCAVLAGLRARSMRRDDAATSAPAIVDSPFYAIGPGTPIEPGGFAPVIRMRLPRRELRRIGMAAWAPGFTGDGGSLEVEVLVGRDGVAKAVRLVRGGERYIQEGAWNR